MIMGVHFSIVYKLPKFNITEVISASFYSKISMTFFSGAFEKASVFSPAIYLYPPAPESIN